ncbi:DUF4124 domain-containing protein [Caenimonas sedimenti]|uniref:DUF4124 domain-containing protein n=1 Tax=Caenimonas sedimenti TaxID=2596921 RepID=UPI0021043420|nr:DUF4124 domain-containing protein [Caenimonas sedimenti]
MSGSVRLFALSAVLAAVAGDLWAQRSIYTCVDGKGRRLTSDRPIPECMDREQKELNASGTVRKTVGPSLTAAERAVIEEQERKAAEERQRQSEEKRRERALLGRYPNQGVHDAERVKALNAVQEVIIAGHKRTQDLRDQRKSLEVEAEFYKKDPSKMPAKLRRSLDENEQMVSGQARFLANQEEEKRRVNAQFDQELVRLKVLWAQARGIPATAAAAPASAPTRQ